MNILLIVEGPHDCQFLAFLLTQKGFHKVQSFKKIHKDWEKIFPNKFPFAGDKLDHVAKFPDIYISSTDNVIGIFVANGDGALANQTETCVDYFNDIGIHSIGIFLDADKEKSPKDRYDAFTQKLTKMNKKAATDGRGGCYPLSFPSAPGAILPGPPKTGIFMFPDNGSAGTLEDILLECAAQTVPEQHKIAADAITAADSLSGKPAPYCTPTGPQKAHAGIIGNLIVPGSSLAVSLEKADWLTPAILTLPRVRAVSDFLDQLLAP